MSSADELAAHLKFFSELGVDGVSRDRAWRTRVEARAEGAESGAHAEGAESAGAEAPALQMGEDAVARGLQPPRTSESVSQSDDDDAPAQRLVEIRTEIGDCTRCKLHTLGRRQIVFGVGNPEADLMFVGEAPGADEDLQGIPFVGRAGQLLTKIIESIDLRRDEVYIANVIKCRPPQNRNPEPDEVLSCQPFLFAQIDTIQPKVIVALGTFAAQALLGTTESISRLRGRSATCRGAVLIPTFHPAYLLRNPSAKRAVWDDMKRARTILRGESDEHAG